MCSYGHNHTQLEPCITTIIIMYDVFIFTEFPLNIPYTTGVTLCIRAWFYSGNSER